MSITKGVSADFSKYLDQVFELEVTDTARGGSGIARIPDGPVVFVPLTAPGDLVRVRITRLEKRYLEGRVQEILRPSPVRVSPRCKVFGECGGCEWQHLPYDLQWKIKTEGLAKALERVNVPSPSEWDFFPAENPWNYRNRIQLRSENQKIGFFKRFSRDLVPIERCEIAREEINTAIQGIQSKAKTFEGPQKFEIAVNAAKETRIFQNQRHAAGGFRQIHDAQNEKLCRWVDEKIKGPAFVLDLYGGSGNFSTALNAKLAKSHCVDLHVPFNSDRFPKIHFHRSTVARWLSREAQKRQFLDPDRDWVVLLDPPREGMGPDSKRIAMDLKTLGLRNLFLINCDPDRWSSDLKNLLNQGYQIERTAVFDFFPQTHHVEAAAHLIL